MKMGTQFEQIHISEEVEIGIFKNGFKSELNAHKICPKIREYGVRN